MRTKPLLAALALAIGAVGAVGAASASQATGNGVTAFTAKVGASTVAVPNAQATHDMPSSSGLLVTAAATASYYSPAGCKGSTNYPHLSGTEASVHGTMICNYAVEQVATATELTRGRWFGYETIARDYSQRDWSTWSGNATPRANCVGQGWYRYRGWSAHKSLEAGIIYSSDTRNWQIPGISEFSC